MSVTVISARTKQYAEMKLMDISVIVYLVTRESIVKQVSYISILAITVLTTLFRLSQYVDNKKNTTKMSYRVSQW